MIYERLKSSTANFTKLLFKTVNTIHSSVCTEVKKFGTVKHFFVVVVERNEYSYSARTR